MKLASYQNLRVPNFSVHNLREVLEQEGLDWEAALRRSDIAVDAVMRPGGTIPAKKELAFQIEFMTLTPDRPDLWVQAARGYTSNVNSIRGMALSTAPTIKAWVDAVTAVDLAPGLLRITPLHTREGELTGLEYTYPETPPELIPLSVYRELFVTSRSLDWLYGEPFPFTQIDFPLNEVAPEALKYVSCAVSCGSDSLRLWWDPATSTNRLPFGNAFQHEVWMRADDKVLSEFRASGDWPATVAKTIRAVPSLNRKLANAAAALLVSPRTLQRRLDETGRDFAQVRDEALADLARDLLSNTDQSVAHISRSLGYADPPSFTAAFRRWTGTSPSAFRESSRCDEDTLTTRPSTKN